jgi:hypothetical protein
MIITRTTFEPGDDKYFDEEGNVIGDSSLQDFIRRAIEQARQEGYQLGQSAAFRKWRPEKAKPSGRVGEQHFSPKDLASKWGVSEQTIRNLFEKESDVLRYGNPESSRSRRRYINVKIPQSVAERVHKRLSAVSPRR